MRYGTMQLCVAGFMVLAAGCPGSDEVESLEDELEEHDEDHDSDEGPMGRAGRGAAGSKAGAAGKGGSAGRAAEPDEEVAGNGAFAGSAADGGKAGKGGSSAADSGGSPAVAGSGGSRAGAGGGAAGSGAYAGAGGAGGKPAAGSGGTGGGSGGVPNGTKLAAITTDAQAGAICDQLRAKIDDADIAALERGTCTLEGLTGELQGNGDCAELTKACLNAPVAAEPPVQDNCTAADIPNCTDVSVDEFVACTLAQIDASATFFGKLTCETDIQSITDIPTPAACASLFQRCPELEDGSSDDGGF